MRKLSLVLVLMCLLVVTVSLSCGQEPDVVRIGTDGEYPPYNFVNEVGEVDGFEADLMDEMCQQANLDCEWVVTPWDGIIEDLVAEEFDVIVSGMSINEERDQVIDFTQPYLPPTPSVYVALTGASTDALEGTIAAGVSTVHSAYLSEIGADFMEFDAVEDAVDSILNGNVDAGLFDRGFAHAIVGESGGKLTVLGQPVLLEEGIGAGVRESDSELKGKLDAAIESMKQDGSLNNLIRKWFDEDAELF
jgi:polar amino acid transport system substrate-binding protein